MVRGAGRSRERSPDSPGRRDSIGRVHLAPDWETAAAAAAGLALVAKAARAVSWSGAAAGICVGVAVAAGFGAPGLVVLGTFFVVGSVATRVGYAKKAARGTAEKRGGARDWRNVVGKGGVAALISVVHTQAPEDGFAIAFTAALAAALADTLGTEIGTLATSAPIQVPRFRRVPTGTPGAVSLVGLAAAALGAVAIALVANRLGLVWSGSPAIVAAVCGFVACFIESVAVGLGYRASGAERNFLMTTIAALPGVFFGVFPP